MKVLYVDLETTGLDPETCQILQVGMLWDDGTNLPIEQCPSIEFLVRHDTYHGDAYALWLNRDLLKSLSEKNIGHKVSEVNRLVSDFLVSCGISIKDRINIGGKNVAGFDLPFLAKLPGFDKNGVDHVYSQGLEVNSDYLLANILAAGERFKWRHRTVDPAMMYVREDDDATPSLDQCLERAGIDKRTCHTALDDCRLACELVRKGFELERQVCLESACWRQRFEGVPAPVPTRPDALDLAHDELMRQLAENQELQQDPPTVAWPTDPKDMF